MLPASVYLNIYILKPPNISHTLVGNKIVDHSDVVGASPMARWSNYIFILNSTPGGFNVLGQDNCKGDKKHLSFGVTYIGGLTLYCLTNLWSSLSLVKQTVTWFNILQLCNSHKLNDCLKITVKLALIYEFTKEISTCSISSWILTHWPLLVPYGAPFTNILAWISNYMPGNVWDEINYPFPNFNGCTIDVWEWISNLSHSLYIMDAITYPYWG